MIQVNLEIPAESLEGATDLRTSVEDLYELNGGGRELPKLADGENFVISSEYNVTFSQGMNARIDIITQLVQDYPHLLVDGNIDVLNRTLLGAEDLVAKLLLLREALIDASDLYTGI